MRHHLFGKIKKATTQVLTISCCLAATKHQPEERHNGSCYELVLAAIRQRQGEIYNRRHGNYDLRPTTQMPTECVPGRVAISPTICLSVSKSAQNVPKATKTEQKMDQKLFKNQSKRLPRSHFVPKAKF